VTAIAPRSKVIAGIVTYEVQLGFDAGGLPIRTGMTATADLITAQRQDVLLAPNRAVIADRSENRYYVQRVDGDSITRTEVMIGLRDSSHTEIIAGIEEGDTIVIGEVGEEFAFGGGPPEFVQEMGRP
jgi:multidrug efflux pump subunit AcrA (membrane-fusion protein)